MAYSAYVTYEYYRDTYGGKALENDITPILKKASRHIDTLTFNRIVSKGINNLTSFQQEIIKESCCELADFELTNEELLSSAFSSYSINGVNMALEKDGYSIIKESGIILPASIYEELKQTGLCWRGI